MNSKLAAVILVAFFSIVCVGMATYAIGFEVLYAPQPEVKFVSIIVMAMGLFSGVWAYALSLPDGEELTEEEAARASLKDAEEQLRQAVLDIEVAEATYGRFSPQAERAWDARTAAIAAKDKAEEALFKLL